MKSHVFGLLILGGCLTLSGCSKKTGEASAPSKPAVQHVDTEATSPAQEQVVAPEVSQTGTRPLTPQDVPENPQLQDAVRQQQAQTLAAEKLAAEKLAAETLATQKLAAKKAAAKKQQELKAQQQAAAKTQAELAAQQKIAEAQKAVQAKAKADAQARAAAERAAQQALALKQAEAQKLAAQQAAAQQAAQEAAQQQAQQAEALKDKVLASGTFTKKKKSIKGAWSIVQENGHRILRFDENFKTKWVDDLQVFLSPLSIATANNKNAGQQVYRLAPLKAKQGAQEYAIPDSVDISIYKSILIHCEEYSLLWGGANIK